MLVPEDVCVLWGGWLGFSPSCLALGRRTGPFLTKSSRGVVGLGAARVLWQAVGNQEGRERSTSGLRRAGRAVWGAILPDRVLGFSIFLLRSLSCSWKNNWGALVSGCCTSRSRCWDVSWPWLTVAPCSERMLSRLSPRQED